MSQPDDTAVLSSEVYHRAFTKVMSGADPALLPDEEQEALRVARTVTRTEGTGYPMPQQADPTRNPTKGT